MTQGAHKNVLAARLILGEADRMLETGFIHDIVPAKRGDN